MARPTRGITEAIKGGARKGGKKRKNSFEDKKPKKYKKLTVTAGTRGIEYTGKLRTKAEQQQQQTRKHRPVESSKVHKQAKHARLRHMIGVVSGDK